jgi:hypothetical protein
MRSDVHPGAGDKEAILLDEVPEHGEQPVAFTAAAAAEGGERRR